MYVQHAKNTGLCRPIAYLCSKTLQMLKKGSKLYSILTGTCPRCQQERMYVHRNPYNPNKLFKMHERCGNCGVKYKMEPSFFYGAMYVSYGLGVALSVASFVIAHLFLDLDLLQSFFVIIGALVVFMPVLIRLSRNIWINLFYKYDPAEVKQ